jgi:hypothetical protein
MAAAIVCDVCGTVIEDVSYGPLKVEGKLCIGTIAQKPDIGDVCGKCLRKEYYQVARQMFEGLQTKRARKENKS